VDAKARPFAEEAIRAIGRSDAPAARTLVSQAVDADQGIGPLADVINLACAEIEDDGSVTAATWNAIADAVPELLDVVEGSRG
jgi:hypothetical protein